ncbi:MAG TPA: hypothetical protein VG099_11650 [Gemmataceae bacterium]|jgi:hypothetical protein|nr:hypothetical protein [Gemmataceae bacterium]
MSSRQVQTVPVPRWLAVLASLAILAHLLVIGARVLDADSGPWVTSMGNSPATGPQFAREIDQVTNFSYLRPLRMGHNYHFQSNRPEQTDVYFEAELKDASGHVLKKLRFPEQSANLWLRHRQLLLARGLAEDMPVQPPQGEEVGAPKAGAPSAEIWEFGPGKVLRLQTIPEHLIPRDHPVFRPSEWSRLLARSYARYLCRMHGAASAEIIRHTKEPLLSAVLLIDESPNAEELVATFGEMKVE